MSQKLTTEEFIKRAREVHGDKYDYSKVKYVNSVTEVCIICKEHGDFWQKPRYHLCGNGCPVCGGTKKSSSSIFVERANTFMEIGMTIPRSAMLITKQKFVLYVQNMENSGRYQICIFVVMAVLFAE